MLKLECENKKLFDKFMKGFHVIRRSDQYWAGIGCDLAIEQTLMRSLKSSGGLTRGSGMSKHQRALWTMSMPVTSAYNEAMQSFTSRIYTTSEQHKEETKSRIGRDQDDFQKVSDAFQTFPPFCGPQPLHNIVTGVNATRDVNVQDMFALGKSIVNKMEGHDVFSYSYKRSMKAITLASSKSIKVSEDRSIDPALLFQRFLAVSQSGNISLSEVLTHELSPYPPALFEAKHVMRQADKAQLIDALKGHVTSRSNSAVLETIPSTEYNVIDGGSLLHRLKWVEGRTYCSITDEYVAFTVKHYGHATVVFDGYGVPTTKDNTHQRRMKDRITSTVTIGSATQFKGKKEDFLSNSQNKQSLIQLISNGLRKSGCHVVQSEGDADLEIVRAAIALASLSSTTLIGEDTDLLVLLLYHTHVSDVKDLYFRSDRGKGPAFDIKAMKEILKMEICDRLLFVHAITGCDTTSRIFGIGKKSVLQKIVHGDPILCTSADTFSAPNQSHHVSESSGKNAMLAIYNGRKTDDLSNLRCSVLCRKAISSKTYVTPERLPPTESATKYHSMRVYFQIMVSMGKAGDMDATNWGWTWDIQQNKYILIIMNNCPAPDTLLKVIHCNCSIGCASLRCSCRKSGLDCTTACGPCQDGCCENMHSRILLDDDDDDINGN